MHRYCFAVTLLMATLAGGLTPALALGSETTVTWLTSARELPPAVAAALSDCRYIAEDEESEWLPDSESGGFRSLQDDGAELYIVTCDFGASNMFDAAVHYAGGKARRLRFPAFEGEPELRLYDMAPNTRFVGGGMLSAYYSAGCAGTVGAEFLYRIARGEVTLVFQKTNESCEAPDWRLVYGHEP
jgi:hypothetical protein